jgi:RHS repeat-associated protein
VWDISNFSRFDPNPHYGRVGYTHGLGVEQQLSLVRVGLDMYEPPKTMCSGDAGRAFSFAPFAAIPLWDWRGHADGAVYASGARQHCQAFASGARCVSAVVSKSWYAYDYNPSGFEWYGTVVGGKRDDTGTMYRRARYYDPQTGRFTQEDPIGLAGGLNLYASAFSNAMSLITRDRRLYNKLIPGIEKLVF